MGHRVPITVRLESFEGPLDLLLYLIQSHELDISKVSITAITDQYLAYVKLMRELNFDTASEFLVMAATLLHWKSKALLPEEQNATAQASEEGNIELTQDELVRQLLDRQRFRAAGESIGQLPRLGEDVFARSNGKTPVEKIWKEMSITDLALSYQEMLINSRKRTQILRKETVSLTDRILELGERLEIGKPTEMRAIMSPEPARAEIVVTFLASLELSRLKKMRLHQEKIYAEIYLELMETLKGFDLQLASGFDAVEEKINESIRATAPQPALTPATTKGASP